MDRPGLDPARDQVRAVPARAVTAAAARNVRAAGMDGTAEAVRAPIAVTVVEGVHVRAAVMDGTAVTAAVRTAVMGVRGVEAAPAAKARAVGHGDKVIVGVQVRVAVGPIGAGRVGDEMPKSAPGRSERARRSGAGLPAGAR